MTETCQWNRPMKDGGVVAKRASRTRCRRRLLARWLLASLGVAVCGTIAAYCFFGQEEAVVLPVKEKKRGRIPEVEPAKVAKYRLTEEPERVGRRKQKETPIFDEVSPVENVLVLSEKEDIEPLLFGAVGTYRYCVIDLSRGANARSYPVTCFRNEPEGGFNTEEYKTEKLVLKRVEPGSFIMGENQTDVSHRVTFAKP